MHSKVTAWVWPALGMMAWGQCCAAPIDDWGARAVEDARRVIIAPTQWDAAAWRRVAELGVLSGALMAGVDDEVDDYHRRRTRHDAVHAARTLDEIASPGVLVGAGAAAWAWGRARGDVETATTGFQVAESALYASALAGGFKFITGRARPATGAGPGEFHGPGWRGDDYLAFPSGHAAAAFAAARAWAPHIETPAARTALYGSAGLVAYSRLPAGKHWLSDVVIGSVLGYWVGATVTREGAGHAAATGRWRLAPTPTGVMTELRW